MKKIVAALLFFGASLFAGSQMEAVFKLKDKETKIQLSGFSTGQARYENNAYHYKPNANISVTVSDIGKMFKLYSKASDRFELTVTINSEDTKTVYRLSNARFVSLSYSANSNEYYVDTRQNKIYEYSSFALEYDKLEINGVKID